MPSESESGKHLPVGLRVAGLALLLALTAEGALHLDFRQPFIGYGLGGAFLLFLAAKPGGRRIAMVGTLAAVIAASAVWGRFEGPTTLLVQMMGALGLASLLW